MTELLRPSWIAGAALTVLSSAAVAAVTLSAAPLPVAAPPAPAPQARLVAAAQAAPEALVLSFPAPAPAQAAPAPAPAPATASRSTLSRTAVAAARRSTSTSTSTNRNCTGRGWEQRRGQAAIQRLRRPADARAVGVAFHAGRPDVLGLAELTRGTVDVYVRSCAKMSDALLLHVVAHELGHVVDGTRLTDAQRDAWKAARGIPASTPWYGCNGCADFATPAGDFAETYAQWQRGSRTSRSQLAPPATPAQLGRLAGRFFPAL